MNGGGPLLIGLRINSDGLIQEEEEKGSAQEENPTPQDSVRKSRLRWNVMEEGVCLSRKSRTGKGTQGRGGAIGKPSLEGEAGGGGGGGARTSHAEEGRSLSQRWRPPLTEDEATACPGCAGIPS